MTELGCDQFHATRLGQLLVELIAVVRFVADNFFRQVLGYTSVEGGFDQRHLMGVSAACVRRGQWDQLVAGAVVTVGCTKNVGSS